MMIINLLLFYYLIQTTLSDVNVYNISNELLQNFDDQNARFGPALPTAGVKGYITTTNPPNGCHKIDPPPAGILRDGYHWIALIPRTNGADSCEFAVKVENAQQANFSAVIVYNYDDTLLPMGSSSKAVHIPSTMITHADGLLLISHYLYNKTTVNATPMYYVKLIPEPPFKLGIYMIPFIVVIAVSFLGLVGFILVRCHLERRRTRRHRLPRSALKQLKVKKFAKTDPWEMCIICLDEFEEGTKIRILPCDHAYHVKCIDRWLIDHRRQCPVCKRYVFPNHDHSDDEESGGRPQQRASTEHTPLINSTETDTITAASNLHYFPHVRRMFNPLQSEVRGISNVSSDSSNSIENLSSSSRQTATTTEVIFNQPSSNSRRYGSIDDSLTTAQRFARRYFDISDETTNDITESMHSIVEHTHDIDTTDDDNQMHSVITSSEDNPSYVPADEESVRDTTNVHL